jgi:hypothetical protein
MKHLLSSTAFLIVNKELAKLIGLKETVLLADLISKEDYFFKNEQITEIVSTDKGWFFNTEKNIEKDTTLSPYQIRKAIEKLKKLGILEVKRKGIPAKQHFKINEEQVVKFINNKTLKKCRTINKNKEIIINNNITFKEEVFSYDYPKEMLQDFYDYWTEPSKSGKLRKDMQKTWCTERRLKTWAKRSKQYDNKTSKIDSQLNEYLKGKELL